MLTASNGGGGGRGNGPFTPISRQTSIYSLTLDELQNTYEPNKNFGSMNMDEFLKNIWTAEESHAMALALASNNETNNAQPSTGGESGGLARQGSLPRQVSLPRTLSRKTVDEVWKDIHRGSDVEAKEQPKEVNYGEMTLEDFLTKAGVVREESEETAGVSTPVATAAPMRAISGFPFGPAMVQGGFPVAGPVPTRASHQATMEAIAQNQQAWANYQLKTAQQHQFMQHAAAAEAAAAAFASAAKRGGPQAVGGTSSGSGVEGSSDGGLGHGNGLSLSPAMATPDTPTRGKKRGHDRVAEKTVERRQRRMIKNRESAARSRARKQAYTVELEAEVTQLKEENLRLKQQQMLDSKLQAEPPSQKKVLRRTKTNPW